MSGTVWGGQVGGGSAERGLGNVDPRVRQRAAEALAKRPQEAIRLARELAALLGDRDLDVRLAVAKTLHVAGAEVRRVLQDTLSAPSALAREWACALLGQLGGHGSEALMLLRHLATADPEPAVRLAAHQAVRSIRGPRPCGP